MTCPRCRKGEMFEKLEIKHPLKMHRNCSVCGQRFEPEIGFYYGAMFISYVFIAIFSLSLVGLCVFVFDLDVDLSFIILITCLALMFLWNLRFSRSIWIHLIVKYDPEAGMK